MTDVISHYNLSIRQAVTDDPFFTDEPVMTVITNDVIPGELVSELRKLRA